MTSFYICITALELNLWADKFVFSLDGIWANTINTLQHQSLRLMSSALDHWATSAIKYSFNSRSVTLSRKGNLEIEIRHIYRTTGSRFLTSWINLSVNMGEKTFSILPKLLGKTSYTSIFPQICFPLLN